MSRIQVEETHTAAQEMWDNFGDVLQRLNEQNPPSQAERVEIEAEILERFQRKIAHVQHEEKFESNDNLTETIADVSLVVSTALTAVSAASAASGVDINSILHNIASGLAHATSASVHVAPVVGLPIFMAVSLWNLHRARKTGQKVKQTHGKIVEWHESYLNALEIARAQVDEAIDVLVDLFVEREMILRDKSRGGQTALEYEMGLRMTRCMTAIDNKLRRYQQLIESAEEALSVIQRNARREMKAAKRNKKRGKMIGMGGAVCTVLTGIVAVGSGGAAVPVVAALCCAVTTGVGCVVYHLSNEQLKMLKTVMQEIAEGKKRLEEHKQNCVDLKRRVLTVIDDANNLVSEAQKDAENVELRRQLAEAKAQNAAAKRRAEKLPDIATANHEAIRAVLREFRVEKMFDVIVNDLEIECVEDLVMIDDEILEEVDCKKIWKKKLLKMVEELKA